MGRHKNPNTVTGRPVSVTVRKETAVATGALVNEDQLYTATCSEHIALGLSFSNDMRVIGLVEKSWAAKSSGIRPGDRIVAVNDLSTVDLTLDEVVGLMNGPLAESLLLLRRPVSVTVLRGGPRAEERTPEETQTLLPRQLLLGVLEEVAEEDEVVEFQNDPVAGETPAAVLGAGEQVSPGIGDDGADVYGAAGEESLEQQFWRNANAIAGVLEEVVTSDVAVAAGVERVVVVAAVASDERPATAVEPPATVETSKTGDDVVVLEKREEGAEEVEAAEEPDPVPDESDEQAPVADEEYDDLPPSLAMGVAELAAQYMPDIELVRETEHREEDARVDMVAKDANEVVAEGWCGSPVWPDGADEYGDAPLLPEVSPEKLLEIREELVAEDAAAEAEYDAREQAAFVEEDGAPVDEEEAPGGPVDQEEASVPPAEEEAAPAEEEAPSSATTLRSSVATLSVAAAVAPDMIPGTAPRLILIPLYDLEQKPRLLKGAGSTDSRPIVLARTIEEAFCLAFPAFPLSRGDSSNLILPLLGAVDPTDPTLDAVVRSQVSHSGTQAKGPLRCSPRGTTSNKASSILQVGATESDLISLAKVWVVEEGLQNLPLMRRSRSLYTSAQETQTPVDLSLLLWHFACRTGLEQFFDFAVAQMRTTNYWPGQLFLRSPYRAGSVPPSVGLVGRSNAIVQQPAMWRGPGGVRSSPPSQPFLLRDPRAAQISTNKANLRQNASEKVFSAVENALMFAVLARQGRMVSKLAELEQSVFGRRFSLWSPEQVLRAQLVANGGIKNMGFGGLNGGAGRTRRAVRRGEDGQEGPVGEQEQEGTEI